MPTSIASRIALTVVSGFIVIVSAMAQTPSAAPPAPKPADPGSTDAPPVMGADPLAQFAWLEGCWRGSVNQHDFREHWLPPRGGLMIGASHTVTGGKTLDYEYLRIEPRVDGVYYVDLAMGPGRKETAYKLVERAMDLDDEVFTFAGAGPEFPQKILYRHNAGGWLYATVAGQLNGADKQVIYPMRHVGCETGEIIKK
jgi:hypothetical protein